MDNPNSRRLEWRRNNAYDSILLVEDGRVVGAWKIGIDPEDCKMSCFFDPDANWGDPDDWDANWPDNENAKDYGRLMDVYQPHLDAIRPCARSYSRCSCWQYYYRGRK